MLFCGNVEIPLPRFGCSFLVAMLLRYASAKDCGERCLLSQNQKDSDHTIRCLILFGSFTEKP
ncbi:hypothetical protein DUG12_24675 [Salmonella enterica]|nr:hypothetical protein [Salmonella enterica]